MKEDNSQKDLYILRFEEELANFQKENEDLSNQILREKDRNKKNSSDEIQIQDSKRLEEKIKHLNNENSKIISKLKNLDKELKINLASLEDYKINFISLEKENFLLTSKLKQLEIISDKNKNENIFLRKENIEIKSIAEGLERKIEFLIEEKEMISNPQNDIDALDLLNNLEDEDNKIIGKISKLDSYYFINNLKGVLIKKIKIQDIARKIIFQSKKKL